METGQARWRLRVTLTLVKATVLGSLLSLVVVGGLRTEAPSSAAPDGDDAYARVLARAEGGQGCSEGDAVIRTEAGRLRVVSFATGWAVYNGRRPGEFLAVCADDPATTAARLRAAG